MRPPAPILSSDKMETKNAAPYGAATSGIFCKSRSWSSEKRAWPSEKRAPFPIFRLRNVVKSSFSAPLSAENNVVFCEKGAPFLRQPKLYADRAFASPCK